MKELIEEIRKSRLSREELKLLELYSKLEVSDNGWSFRYNVGQTEYFRYDKGMKMLEWYVKTAQYIFGDEWRTLGSTILITNTIKKFNIFPDLEIKDIR